MNTPGLDADLRLLLDRTGSLWRDLAGGRVLITGGTGFVGRWMLEALAAADAAHGLGVRATLVTRSPEALVRRAPELASWAGLTLLRGDVRNFELPEGSFDHVLHAASIPTPPTDGREILDVCLRGTRRTLEAATLAEAGRFLFVSSGAVYGPQPANLSRIPEDYRGGGESTSESGAIAVGKRAAELMSVLEGRAGGFTVTVARGFAFLGPFLPLDRAFAAGNFVRDVLNGGPIAVQGDGTPIRSYLYAADMAEWLWTIHLRGVDGTAYNVGGEEEVSIAELAARMALAGAAERESPTPIAVRFAQVADPRVPPQRYVPSIERARDALQLVPTVGLDEGIRRTVEFARISHSRG